MVRQSNRSSATVMDPVGPVTLPEGVVTRKRYSMVELAGVKPPWTSSTA